MKLKLDVVERIVSGKGIKNGAWLHLRNPKAGGELVYLDPETKLLPSRIKVRSRRHPDYENYQYDKQAAAAEVRSSRAKGRDEIIRDLIKNEQPGNFAQLFLECENLSEADKGVIITPEKDDLIEMGKLPEYAWIVEQVIGYAFEDTNYGEPPAETKKGNARAAEG